MGQLSVDRVMKETENSLYAQMLWVRRGRTSGLSRQVERVETS